MTISSICSSMTNSSGASNESTGYTTSNTSDESTSDGSSYMGGGSSYMSDVGLYCGFNALSLDCGGTFLLNGSCALFFSNGIKGLSAYLLLVCRTLLLVVSLAFSVGYCFAFSSRDSLASLVNISFAFLFGNSGACLVVIHVTFFLQNS